MRTKLFAGVAFAALMIPASAYAQSTGAIDFEGGEEIVVTGSRTDNGVGGVQLPDTSKSRSVLDQEFISRQSPGKSINDTINQVPGVSFQSNDPYGSAGGTMTIRGFDNSRINQTFDGLPLNDTGNYQLYSNQQLDPELIQQVNVNLGSTDVDSPTAAASGSTVNYRSRNPSENFGAYLSGSRGDFDFFRMFGMVDTGVFTSFGTRAFFAASNSENDNAFNGFGHIHKQQYNAKVYQPIGSNGDFMSVSGHYNQNRNNFFGSVPLRTDLPRVVGTDSANRFPRTKDERFYVTARCQINQAAVAETAAQIGASGYADPDGANSCGSVYDYRYNPSNTGNVRANSRFSLSDSLTLTVDPSYQFSKATGGGTVVGQEGRRDVNSSGGTATIAQCSTTPTSATNSCQIGYIGGTPYFGRDLNGDGDALDSVRVYAPSITVTHRIGVVASLRYELNANNTVRVAYTYDRGKHRQTGELGLLQLNGLPFDFFTNNERALADGTGATLQKRDRLSFAILHQASAEYRGEFGPLRVNLGVRAPWFTRNLTNNCATSSASGFVECFEANSAGLAAYLAANPTQSTITLGTFQTQGPQQRRYKYNRVLPQAGLNFDLAQNASVYFNYSKGLQVPGTDTLYNAFYFPFATASAQPKPETTDNFDLGVRYRTGKLIAQASVWYTKFQNRLSTAYDPDTERSIYRNLGEVEKYGIDASIAYQPIPELSFYVFGSALKSEIKDNVELARVNTAGSPLGPVGTIIYAQTKGKFESLAPKYTLGGRIQGNLGPLEIGGQVKRTGERYIYDTNLPVMAFIGTPATAQAVYGASTPAYTIVDLDARLKLDWLGLGDKTFFQLNVSNLFDELYVGSFGNSPPPGIQTPTYNFTTGAITAYGTAPNVQIGSPRAVMGSFVFAF